MRYHFDKAYLPTGWANDIVMEIKDGHIQDIHVGTTSQDAEKVSGLALPGFPNCHSHAFQKALAGLTEYSTNPQDSFWTWRDLMYRFANLVTPDDLRHIAAFLYMEMLKNGYTAVAEFHYLHHQPGGMPYDNPAEMSLAIHDAAQDAGISLTHLPVLYSYGGFGKQSLEEKQLRFRHDVDSFLKLLDILKKSLSSNELGAAFHSLRAVSEESFSPIINALGPDAPLHIHIAEQMKEVDDCRNWSGQTPVEYLLSHADINARWCLVHATHMTRAETEALARSGAVAGLCPTTEANLGDGFFNLGNYDGAFAIGSDSNMTLDPKEEIRWLEYGQRLVHQRRNIGISEDFPHAGEHLFRKAMAGGAQALGKNIGRLEKGARADVIVFDAEAPSLCHIPDDSLLDSLIFAASPDPQHVMVEGKWCIRDKHHPAEEQITRRYVQTVEKLRCAGF